jgi:hypothetical protein
MLVPKLGNEIVWNAFSPKRMRHGKLFSPCDKNLINKFLIPFDKFSRVEFSSNSQWSDNKMENVLNPDFTSSHFSFHSDAELNPYVRIFFKKMTRLAMIVLENRSGVEGRIKKLIVRYSRDGVNFDPLCIYEVEFGGWYDNSPLIISLPYFFEAMAVEFCMENITPDCFHLKTICFYGNAPLLQ